MNDELSDIYRRIGFIVCKGSWNDKDISELSSLCLQAGKSSTIAKIREIIETIRDEEEQPEIIRFELDRCLDLMEKNINDVENGV